jgi:hypothetical protein
MDNDIWLSILFGVKVGAPMFLVLFLISRIQWRRYNDRDGKQRRALVLFLGPGWVYVRQFVWREGQKMRWVNDTHWQVLPEGESGFRREWWWTRRPHRLHRGKVVGDCPWVQQPGTNLVPSNATRR